MLAASRGLAELASPPTAFNDERWAAPNVSLILLSEGPIVANVSINGTCAFQLRKYAGIHPAASRFVSRLVPPLSIPASFSMTPYQKRLTPITKRMAGDMKIRHLAQASL